MEEKELGVNDCISLYAQHIQLLTTEMNLIRQRFNAMLVANSIVFSFLVSKLDSLGSDERTMTWVLGGGIILCISWLILNFWGWKTGMGDGY